MSHIYRFCTPVMVLNSLSYPVHLNSSWPRRCRLKLLQTKVNFTHRLWLLSGNLLFIFFLNWGNIYFSGPHSKLYARTWSWRSRRRSRREREQPRRRRSERNWRGSKRKEGCWKSTQVLFSPLCQLFIAWTGFFF